MPNPLNPLIIQSDRTLLLDVHAPLAGECRAALIPFAELERSPEHLHTYRLTPLSLWNAASSGVSADAVCAALQHYARYAVPPAVLAWVAETAGRFGVLRLVSAPSAPSEAARQGGVWRQPSEGTERWVEPRGGAPPLEQNEKLRYEQAELLLLCSSERAYRELLASAKLKKILAPCDGENISDGASAEEKKYCFKLLLVNRGTAKNELLHMGYPVRDDVPLRDGEPLDVRLREITLAGKQLAVRKYQSGAADALVGNKGAGTGFGTIVLPCGAGKTIVGMVIMERLKTNTLIVTTNISAAHQWIAELIDKTDLSRDDIAEYTGESKNVAAVTVATYQILTWRPHKTGAFPHFELFRARDWGLIIYDEVHLLPAPVFRVAAELQSVRRVGLTATLVREDGLEGMVFSLVGPKRWDVPWKELEEAGWIAKAECVELRIDLDESREIEYAVSPLRAKHRLAGENPAKFSAVQALVERFYDDKILVIGQYLNQLAEIQKRIGAPLITGKTPSAERDTLYDKFRSGEVRVLIVSKVANFAIDLPDASMAIQVSGTFGSRQEEAQRLGRILRPKERTSRFWSLVTRNTVEEDFSANRQKFLAEQGYAYRLIRYHNESSLDALYEIQGESGDALCITGDSA